MQVAEGKVLGPLRKGHSHCWWALMRGKGRFWKCSARSSFPRLPGLFSLQHHLSAELRQTSAPEDSRLQEEGQERERPQGHSRVGGGLGGDSPEGERRAGSPCLSLTDSLTGQWEGEKEQSSQSQICISPKCPDVVCSDQLPHMSPSEDWGRQLYFIGATFAPKYMNLFNHPVPTGGRPDHFYVSQLKGLTRSPPS